MGFINLDTNYLVSDSMTSAISRPTQKPEISMSWKRTRIKDNRGPRGVGGRGWGALYVNTTSSHFHCGLRGLVLSELTNRVNITAN